MYVKLILRLKETPKYLMLLTVVDYSNIPSSLIFNEWLSRDIQSTNLYPLYSYIFDSFLIEVHVLVLLFVAAVERNIKEDATNEVHHIK